MHSGVICNGSACGNMSTPYYLRNPATLDLNMNNHHITNVNDLTCSNIKTLRSGASANSGILQLSGSGTATINSNIVSSTISIIQLNYQGNVSVTLPLNVDSIVDGVSFSVKGDNDAFISWVIFN